MGEWNAIECASKDGRLLDCEGKVFVFTDKNLKYFENKVEIKEKACVYVWETEDSVRLTAESGEARLWRISFDDSENLIVDDDIFNVIWTLSKDKQNQPTPNTDDNSKVNVNYKSANQNRIVGIWDAINCAKITGVNFDHRGKVFEFTQTNLKYYENGNEILSKRCSYSWLSDTLLRLTSSAGEKRDWIVAFNTDNKITVIDTTYEAIWTLEKRVTDNKDALSPDKMPYISQYHLKILGIWNAVGCDRNGTTLPFEGKTFAFNSDMTLKYYENGVEITDKACMFSWTDITKMKLKTESGEEREWILSTDTEGNLIIQDDTYGLMWTLKRGV